MRRLAAFLFALLVPALAPAQYNSYTYFAPGTAPSYEGLWWNAAESGWGVSIAHQGDVLFAVWYTYDRDGSPTWFFMPDARLVGDDMEGSSGMMDMEMMGMMRNSPMYAGALYRSSASGGKVAVTAVGTALFLFKSRNSGVFSYTVGNVSGAREIALMQFAPGGGECSLGGTKVAGSENYQDLWWNPGDSGWGVNIAQQGNTLFATYYTYGADGRAEWYVMPNTVRVDAGAGDARYRGPMFRATGPAYDAPWDSSRGSLADRGEATLRFDARGEGSFNVVRDGMSPYGKALVRMAFGVPASICR